MARSIEEIQAEIYQEKENHEELNELNSTSKTALWRLWIYIVSVAIWSLEKIFDLHRAEIDERIRVQKNFRLPWYKEMALNFQYGQGLALVDETDYYDNSKLTEEEIEASKIVKYAAVIEQENALIVKIATEKNGELQRISNEEESAFVHYMNRIKAAGVEVRVINSEPDMLAVDLLVFYDPLLMKKDGSYIDGSAAEPVKEAIKEYMKILPFNGELVLEHLTDHLQKLKGVAIPHLQQVRSKWLDGEYTAIAVRKVPESGYFKVDETELNITYEPNI
ncbi:nucleotidyltransferase [Ornithobacterium rhinotracheale]|uniref:nucleotidyltransferase n=1 Tax=Ornithobacterium rhinotracheale TaxID=28251 RepID=UPI00129CF23A|nr:nucleotidyltransferase [Ornithobacterium rhinotracheale]MRJ11386.1 nucleotidyltransferase [Ornithobacterium rhinotracheale]